MELEHLPGGELVAKGLADLDRGVESTEALLVCIGAERLRAAGIAVPAGPIHLPEHRLYASLAANEPDSAHGRFNALVRLLVSFERAVEAGLAR